jgi:pyruvate/2-oxoglutarate dehydrogenase complex dihydrolipoamide acyltransferase (E2) component
MAKIIIPSGSENVKVGTLVAIVCEEQSDVAAFTSYVPAQQAAAVAPTPAPAPALPTPPPSVAPTPVPAKIASLPPQVVAAPPVAAKPPQIQIQTPAPVTIATASTKALKFENWGKRVFSSPLASKLASMQKDYDSKYGNSLQGVVVSASSSKKA